MQASWIVGLAFVGCTFDHGVVPVDAPAEPDVPVALDTDGDGVADATDNCPSLANSDQRDHDDDGHGDVCDRCPHVASTADPDADGDDVGDDCDPRPMMAGDRRMLWEPFDSATAITGWSNAGTGGMWRVNNGVLAQPEPAQDTVLAPPGTFQRPYVATKLKVTSVGPGAYIGVRTGALVNFTQNYACLMQPGPSLLSLSFSAGTQDDKQTATWSGSFGSGAEIVLVQNRAADNACSATQATFSAKVSTPIADPGVGRLELYTRDATAEFDFLFVVEIGN